MAVALGGQKKPAWPLVGETYSGVWPSGPDGMGPINVFGEQVSEDITRIELESTDGLFRLEGVVEY